MSRALFAVCLALLCGCASIRKQQALNQQMEHYTFDKPVEQVFPEARALLFEQGYAIEPGTQGPYALETEPKYNGNQSSFYLVQGIPIDASHCQVQIRESISWVNNSAPPNVLRAGYMEFKLLERVDPAAAAQMSAEAEKAANAR